VLAARCRKRVCWRTPARGCSCDLGGPFRQESPGGYIIKNPIHTYGDSAPEDCFIGYFFDRAIAHGMWTRGDPRPAPSKPPADSTHARKAHLRLCQMRSFPARPGRPVGNRPPAPTGRARELLKCANCHRDKPQYAWLFILGKRAIDE